MGSTARLVQSPPVRRDLAWRHATETDLERISFTIDLSRWRSPRDGDGDDGGGGSLSNRAIRVLRFFAALHRCGRVGYIGTRASYSAIGAAISRVTCEAASRSTVIRGVNELRAAGLLDRSRGRGDRKRQIGPEEWIAEPLAVLTLTPAAIAIWTDPPSLSHPSPPVSKCDGYNSPRELPGSPRDREVTPETDVSNASPNASAVPSTSNAEPASAGVEPRGVAAPHEPRQSARPVAPLAPLADVERPEVGAGQGACQRQRLRFTSSTRPTNRGIAVSAMLATLTSLTRFGGRDGAALVARAKAEISGRSDAAPSGVAWDYWIARWPELVRVERFRWARAEILPLLRSTRASTSPTRIAAARPPASPPPADRPPFEPSPPPRPPASPPGPPAAIAEGEPDAANPYADVFARMRAQLAAKTATTCRSSES